MKNIFWKLLGARRIATTRKNEVIYAIGDIHGRFDLFKALIKRIESDWERRQRPGSRLRVIVLGDFIDRGSDSRRLITRFMSLRDSRRFVVLPGNHEVMMLESALGNAAAQEVWMCAGGVKTLASFCIDGRGETEDSHAFGERIVAAVSPEVIEWIRDLPVSATSGDYFFCHAGVRPGVRLRKQSHDDLLWIREPFMASRCDHGAVVVHGHNAVDDVEVRPNRISLDTGAYQTNRLSAVCLDGDARSFLTVCGAP